MTDASAARALAPTLTGHDGSVRVGDEMCMIGFLRDAMEWIDDGHSTSLTVPFHVSTLVRVVAFCRSLHKSVQGSEGLQRSFFEITRNMEIHVLFDVLRAANFLECETLLRKAAEAVAQILRATRGDPEVLRTILCVEQNSSSSSFLPWGAEWHRKVTEPIFEPPSSALLMQPGGLMPPHLADEDALYQCLLECDVPTLQALKGLSASWCTRARSTLCNVEWQLKQKSIDLEWALLDQVREPSLKNRCSPGAARATR